VVDLSHHLTPAISLLCKQGDLRAKMGDLRRSQLEAALQAVQTALLLGRPHRCPLRFCSLPGYVCSVHGSARVPIYTAHCLIHNIAHCLILMQFAAGSFTKIQ
jgi:hypothetical protein